MGKPLPRRAAVPFGAGRAGRARARIVFGTTVAALVLLAGLPLGLSLAHAEPQIQLLNPSPGTSLIVSDKQQAFRLNSWVSEVPNGAMVEYELDITSDHAVQGVTTQTVLLGQATRSGNAFDLAWDLDDTMAETGTAGPVTTSYAIRAILYADYSEPGTGIGVSIDEQEITINRRDDADPTQRTPEDAGETVKFMYPTNGGPLGVYIRPNGSGGNFTMEAIVSQHIRFVRPFYTKSPPGEEPVWRACGIAGGRFKTVEGARFVSIRCTIPAGDYALDVTGVALVTNDTPSPTPAGQAQVAFDDSADALSVTPYYQRAARITMDPPSIGDVPVDVGCPLIKATVLDQNDRPIGNMNVDAHLQGPSDQVRFGTIFPAPDSNNLNKPPDRGHGIPENAASCLNGPKEGTGGKQAEHNVVGGLDTKHIETTTGTDLAGTFLIGVTADRAGASQLTVWADADDDDSFCFDEVAGAASVGWLQPAPTPVLLAPESTGCSVAVPSPSPTPTPSASAGSPSPSSTIDPGTRSRSIDIQFGHAPLIVSGHVSAQGDTDECTEDVKVKVQRMLDGRFETIRSTTTNENGRYEVALKDRPGRYRAVAPKATRGDGLVCQKAYVISRHIH